MSNKNKGKNVDIRCYSQTPEFVKRMLKLGVPPGMFHTSMEEEFPILERGASEKVISGMHNSDIVLGRDRQSSLASGYGGKGGNRCGSIDLVVGRLSGVDRTSRTGVEVFECDATVLTGPNFAADAARVYISQRTNIDAYLGLNDADRGTHLKGKAVSNASGVVMKADHARVVGRNSVKIYAGKGIFEGLDGDGERDSQGGKLPPAGIIELVAGNGNKLQPAVLGDNLVTVLKHIFKMLKDIMGMINTIHTLQQGFYAQLAGHVHQGAGIGAIQTFPDPALLAKSFENFAKHSTGSYDTILRQYNLVLKEINALGLGKKEKIKLPGNQDILSTSIFLT